ncbi:unnamed protein product, partial [Candidula unifasciata]
MGTMYYGRAVVLLLWIFCSSVISKPTNEDGQNGNPVVNMNADGEQGNGNPNPDRGSEILDNKSPDNPLAGQENSAPANGETSAQDNQERNIHVNQESSPPASQEHNPISNQDSDRQTNPGGNTAANEGTDHQNQRQQSDVHNQVTDNENPQKSAVQQTEEVDWGHADTANVMMRLSINQEQNVQTEQQQHADQQQQTQQQQQTEQQQHTDQQQQEQQQQHAQQQQQSEQQQQTQEEVRTDKTEIAHEASESTQQDHTGEQTNAGHDIGVLEPEHVLHGDDGHGDHHAGAENATSIKEQEEARVQDAQERIAVEKQEMEDVQPKVVGSNVHDSLSRRIAEFVKDKQFSPENADEAIHGGHHVHEEKDGGRPKDVQTGNVESIVHGEDGVHDDHHKKDDKGPLTVDPEQMMHAGQGDDHPHDRHENEPVGESPNGTLLSDNNRRTKNQSQNNQGDFGIDLEPIVHEGEHVHGKAGSQKSRNKVRYQDIIELGLSQELLKGIDLSKLLEQEKKEMEAWQHDKNERKGMSEEDNSETEQNALFWQK